MKFIGVLFRKLRIKLVVGIIERVSIKFFLLISKFFVGWFNFFGVDF